MSIRQNFCQEKIFQLQSQAMSNAITCINKRFAVKNYGICCLTLIFNLNNLRMTMLQSKTLVQECEIWRVIFSLFRYIDTKLWLSGGDKLLWVWRYGFDPYKVLKLSAVQWPYCVALSLSVHNTCYNTCSITLQRTAAPNKCFLLKFRQWRRVANSRWQGFDSQHEHPTFTILEHLEQGWARTSPMCGPGPWAVIIACCILHV